MPNAQPQEPPLALKPADAARLVGWNLTDLRQAYYSGRLPYYKVGKRVMIPRADLLAFMEQHRVEATR